MRIGVGFLVIVLCYEAHGLNRLDVIYKWKSVDFEFPHHNSREDHIRRGDFVPGNSVPIDVDVWINGKEHKTFITIPKFKNGIPVSLATVSDKKNGEHHLLAPYPDWSWHTKGCDGLTSVFRTQIDRCGRLWVIDSGRIDLLLNTSKIICPPQLVAFGLETQRVDGVYKFSDNLLQERSILANLAVDVRGDSDHCQDTFVYVADVGSYAMLVFDAKNGKAWRAQSNTMYPYPPHGVFTANNVEFDLMDGILGMALAPMKRGDRTLYYHSLASLRESWISTSILRNDRHFVGGINKVPRQFKMSDEVRSSQSIAEAFDRNGILYFGMMNDNSINCWNSETPYKSSNIHRLVQDDNNLQFASGLKIIVNENGEEEIWVMTDRFQLLMIDSMKQNEVNFRVLKGKVGNLLANSPCNSNKAITFPYNTQPQNENPYPHPPNSQNNANSYAIHNAQSSLGNQNGQNSHVNQNIQSSSNSHGTHNGQNNYAIHNAQSSLGNQNGQTSHVSQNIQSSSNSHGTQNGQNSYSNQNIQGVHSSHNTHNTHGTHNSHQTHNFFPSSSYYG